MTINTYCSAHVIIIYFHQKSWSLEQYLSLHDFGHKSWVIDSSPNGSLAKLSKNVLFLPSLFGVDMWISEGKAWRNWRNLFDWETVQWPLIAVSTTVAQIEIIAEPLWPLKLQQIYKHWSRKFPVQIKRNCWNNGNAFHHTKILTRQVEWQVLSKSHAFTESYGKCPLAMLQLLQSLNADNCDVLASCNIMCLSAIILKVCLVVTIIAIIMILVTFWVICLQIWCGGREGKRNTST